MLHQHVEPEGWVLQAFSFALDPTEEQSGALRRHFGARRYAYNWTIGQIRQEMALFRECGVSYGPPSLMRLRKRWNRQKHEIAVDAEGNPWWTEVSKEAFANGVADAVTAYWNWQKSLSGRRDGRPVGFPRFRKKSADQDRYRVTTGSFGLVDRRHLRLPRIGAVRTHENMRRLHRLLGLNRARLLNVTVRRKGDRILAVYQVEVRRPQSNHRPSRPDSRVGVDAGVRRLATVAAHNGQVIERIENPRPLERSLRQMRAMHRARSRCIRGSVRYRRRTDAIRRLSFRVANQRGHAMHVLTTRLAKTHGSVVVEDLNVAGMLRQKGLPGARGRRRRLSDAGMGELRRQLEYKCGWYGSELVLADRYYPSSRLCSACGLANDISWRRMWTCEGCGVTHQRDDNAAINLARYSEGDVGAVGALDKRGVRVRPVVEWAEDDETTKTCRDALQERVDTEANPAMGCKIRL